MIMSEENVGQLEGKPKKRRGRWLKRLVIAMAVFVVLLLAGGYFAFDWVLGKARVLVEAELAKNGVYVGYNGVSRSPLRGLVFEDLVLFATEKKEEPLLLISDIGLLPGWRQWLDGEELSVKLSMKQSEISMLVAGEVVEKFERVDAMVQGTASGLQIKQFSGVGSGIDYQLAGRVDFPKKSGKRDDGAKEGGKADRKQGPLIDFSFWKPLQEWLTVENSDGGSFKVVSDFAVDTADLDAMTASAELSGQSFTWHGVAFDHLRAKVDYSQKEQVVVVEGLDLSYRGQLAKGACRYSLESNSLQLEGLESQLDGLSLFSDFSGKQEGQGKRQLVLAKPPRLGIDGRLDFAEMDNSVLHIDLLETEEVAVDFGGEVFAVSHLGGKLVMEKGRLSTVDDGVTARYAKGDKRVSFGQGKGSLEVGGEFDMEIANPASVEVKASLRGENFAWSGVGFDKLSVDASYSGEKRLVDAHSIRLSYQGRTLSGACGYVLGAKTIDIKGLDSRIDFLALANAFTGGETGKEGQPLLFQEPPRLGVDGQLDFGEFKNSNLVIQFLETEKVVMVSGETTVELTEPQGKVRFEGGKAHTLEPGVRAGFVGGNIALSGEAAVLDEALPFQANLRLDDLAMAELMALSGKSSAGSDGERNNGRLFFSYEGSGGKDLLLKDGKGSVKLSNADLGRVPIISGLFQVLGRVVPTLGQRRSGKPGEQLLTGNYVVENGVVSMDDLAIETDLTRIEAKVGYDLSNKMTKFNGKANLSGAVGLVTGVASRLLEIEGGGPIGDIDWRLSNLNATGLLKSGVGGVMDTGKGAVKIGGDTAKDAVKAGGKATMEALKVGGKGTEGVLNGAGKVGEGIKKMLPFGKRKEQAGEVEQKEQTDEAEQ